MFCLGKKLEAAMTVDKNISNNIDVEEIVDSVK